MHSRKTSMALHVRLVGTFSEASPLSWPTADWFMEECKIPSDWTLEGLGGIWLPEKGRHRIPKKYGTRGLGTLEYSYTLHCTHLNALQSVDIFHHFKGIQISLHRTINNRHFRIAALQTSPVHVFLHKILQTLLRRHEGLTHHCGFLADFWLD